MSGKIPVDMVEDPELRAALTEACEQQYRGWLYGGDYKKAESKDEIGETLKEIEEERKRLMDKHREYMRQAELARREAETMRNPHMREITENLRRKHGYSGEVCPDCGRPIRNKKNGEPWCPYCDKPVKPEPKSYTFKEPDGGQGGG